MPRLTRAMDKYQIAEILLKMFESGDIQIPVAGAALLLCVASIINMAPEENRAQGAAAFYTELRGVLDLDEPQPTEH